MPSSPGRKRLQHELRRASAEDACANMNLLKQIGEASNPSKHFAMGQIEIEPFCRGHSHDSMTAWRQRLISIDDARNPESPMKIQACAAIRWRALHSPYSRAAFYVIAGDPYKTDKCADAKPLHSGRGGTCADAWTSAVSHRWKGSLRGCPAYKSSLTHAEPIRDSTRDLRWSRAAIAEGTNNTPSRQPARRIARRLNYQNFEEEEAPKLIFDVCIHDQG